MLKYFWKLTYVLFSKFWNRNAIISTSTSRKYLWWTKSRLTLLCNVLCNQTLYIIFSIEISLKILWKLLQCILIHIHVFTFTAYIKFDIKSDQIAFTNYVLFSFIIRKNYSMQVQYSNKTRKFAPTNSDNSTASHQHFSLYLK